MKYIEPIRVKVLMIMFYATGVVGMVIGLTIAPSSSTVIITFMGVINFGLGAFFTFVFLTQVGKEPDKRKKKRKGD
ncbi:hypothetical protein BD31_I1452 [Candidatus Nitrosopumilus salaria BD31]|uniref:Uncharacterized protein n=1 Tax=Candidatus Nitrosopumilus salarius BD31 TaxID=859350 RepID=I3D5L1_9ARCH|nr:hypothetical protein [Candidatus Nitrosopumilus salaria]EIJ67004.1 hypothetical protein BD31_I1452 [Candidatus Nitrosopumilus salaria BD31]